jgi:hypothetical protein
MQLLISTTIPIVYEVCITYMHYRCQGADHFILLGYVVVLLVDE